MWKIKSSTSLIEHVVPCWLQALQCAGIAYITATSELRKWRDKQIHWAGWDLEGPCMPTMPHYHQLHGHHAEGWMNSKICNTRHQKAKSSTALLVLFTVCGHFTCRKILNIFQILYIYIYMCVCVCACAHVHTCTRICGCSVMSNSLQLHGL